MAPVDQVDQGADGPCGEVQLPVQGAEALGDREFDEQQRADALQVRADATANAPLASQFDRERLDAVEVSRQPGLLADKQRVLGEREQPLAQDTLGLRRDTEQHRDTEPEQYRGPAARREKDVASAELHRSAAAG